MKCKSNCSLMLKVFLFTGLFLVSVLVVTSFNREIKQVRLAASPETLAALDENKIRELNLRNNEFQTGGENLKYRVDLSADDRIELRGTGNQYNLGVAVSNDPPLIFYIFQILFWLFLISPPIIVVLLLVIIKKMDRKK